jgi:hypothetical protein
MGLFRKEPLHRRLAREGGLLEPDREDLRPSWDKVGVHGVHRPREWDAVVTATAPEVGGAEVEFVSLPDASLIVDQEQGDGDLTPLAEAIETHVAAPYRAHGVRRGGHVWAVAARRIEVASFRADGDEIELSEHGGVRTLTVDGAPGFGTVRELERIGRREGDSYVVRARRLDGDLWEVAADPL